MKSNRLRIILRSEEMIGRGIADRFVDWIGSDAYGQAETDEQECSSRDYLP